MERVVGGRKQESKETLLLKEDYFKCVEKFISRGYQEQVFAHVHQADFVARGCIQIIEDVFEDLDLVKTVKERVRRSEQALTDSLEKKQWETK